MDNLVLSFDIGTQSTRAMLINPKGQIELMKSVSYHKAVLDSQVKGCAEQAPDYYYERIVETSQAIVAEDKARPEKKYIERIKAVTVTTIRDTVMLLDKDNRPLRNIIVWMDERRADGKPSMQLWKKVAFWMTGMTETVRMLYRNSFYNWISENEPNLMEKASKFCMMAAYLNYRLTGVLKDGKANQVGHIPFDNKNRTWMRKGLSRCVADVPMSMLVDLVETGEPLGYITEQASAETGIPAGLPLIATGTDKGCESLGLSINSPDKAAISLGTAATIQFCSDKYFEPDRFLPSYPAVRPGFFNAETQIYRGYWTVTWFIRNFAQSESDMAEKDGVSAEQAMDRQLSTVPAGCNGLLFTPHMAPGAGNPLARSVMVGLSDCHTKVHFYRAIIEGIDFELYHAMKRMEKRGKQQIRELYVAGGGSKSDEVVQICADVFGLPIKRIQTSEATGIGAAIAAFVGIGEFLNYDEAVAAMVHDKDVFIPNRENHRVYERIYQTVYRHVEQKNQNFNKKMRDLKEEDQR